MSRGTKLNNPGDIRISTINWVGKVTPSKDPDFETFEAPEYGIRAIVKILLSDADKGINTVASIISKYAPSSENNTSAYIASVAKSILCDSNTPLDLHDYKNVYGLVKAIIIQEDGSNIYTDDIINKGIQLAGVTPNAKVSSIDTTNAFVLFLRKLFGKS